MRVQKITKHFPFHKGSWVNKMLGHKSGVYVKYGYEFKTND